MPLRKKILSVISLFVFVLLLAGIWYAWRALPIISGYGAKNMASAIYLQHRKPADILKEDLGSFPLSLGTFTVNEADSSVTGSVWGFAKRKAIYRKGLGCTLINDYSEADIRSQQFALPAARPTYTDSLAWPYGDRVSDTLPKLVNKDLLQKAIINAMQATVEGKPAYTRSVLVVYDGKIVGEQYAPGFDKNTVMLGWSMSKSLTSALIGVLVKAGKLSVDAPAPVPEWKGTDKEGITLKHLLQQTSGLDFEEDYANPSEVTNMLFKKGDMAAYTAQLPLKHKPGTFFYYSSGNTNILSRIIRHTVGEASYAAFPYQALFHKLNMYSALLEPDASGTFIGSSYSYATARDFARFGLLYLNNGVWNGEQILPAQWVQQSISPSIADPRKQYGYQFWLNGLSDDNPSQRVYPDVPADMFYAAGYGGQNIYIIPSKKLVVVRTGLQKIDGNKFLKEV
ncbi:MAG TPA: serine hydrolase, partial [Flavisolibacter sp.]|nr:serine hydrolase [Flavisolibacter sp.]